MITAHPSGPIIAFTHLPKTAGTTLHHILRRTFGTRYLVVAKEDTGDRPLTVSGLAQIRRLYPRLRAFGGHRVLPTPDMEQAEGGLRFMTMLREPADRCASHYAHEKATRGATIPFPDWVAQPRIRNAQTRRFSDPADADVAISVFEEKFFFVGLVEDFAASIELLRQDVPELAIPPRDMRRNTSRSAEIKAEVLGDPVAIAAIEETQAQDVRLHDYVKNTMWSKRVTHTRIAASSPSSEMRAQTRARLSRLKERLLFGVRRRRAGPGRARTTGS